MEQIKTSKNLLSISNELLKTSEYSPSEKLLLLHFIFLWEITKRKYFEFSMEDLQSRVTSFFCPKLNISKLIYRMCRKNIIERTDKGFYKLKDLSIYDRFKTEDGFVKITRWDNTKTILWNLISNTYVNCLNSGIYNQVCYGLVSYKCGCSKKEVGRTIREMINIFDIEDYEIKKGVHKSNVYSIEAFQKILKNFNLGE